MGIGTVQQHYNGEFAYANYKAGEKYDINVTKSQNTARTSAKRPLVLNYSDGDTGEKAIGAICDARTGISVAVYPSAGDSSERPVYRMKIWSPDGEVEERMADPDRFDPQNADSFDQYAFSCASQKEYGNPFTSTLYPTHDTVKDPLDCLYTKRDWTSVYRNYMQGQYDAGCWDGYLRYKAIYDRMMEQVSASRRLSS